MPNDRKRKRTALIGISSLVMVAMVFALAASTKTSSPTKDSWFTGRGKGGNSHHIATSLRAVETACAGTDYVDLCQSTLSKATSAQPKDLVQTSFSATMEKLEFSFQKSSSIHAAQNDARCSEALVDCKELMQTAIGDLKRSMDEIGAFEINKIDDYVENMRIWLSGALTMQETCIDSFENTTGNTGKEMKDMLHDSMILTTNSLSMATGLSALLQGFSKIPVIGGILKDKDHSSLPKIPFLHDMLPNKKGGEEGGKQQEQEHPLKKIPVLGGMISQAHSKEKSEGQEKGGEAEQQHSLKDIPVFGGMMAQAHAKMQGGFPQWVNTRERNLLQKPGPPAKADVVVAKDGSGKYKTIKEALKAVPLSKSNKASTAANRTFVIHIKEGIYKEELRVEKNMMHVMFIGDGPLKTKITGRKNFADGITTYKTATVSIFGSNFIGKDIGFENTAGAVKHQAVALMVQSDMSIFFNCRMDGYQDTLYTHSYRQFYRDCTVTGTIDFVFGDAAAVFQNCKFIIRKPMENQKCIVTAQGRTDQKEATGFVLQNCAILAHPLYYPLRAKNRAFLGRPWKKFSRTIIMQSYIDASIAPEGWEPWAGNFALDTLFYAEFQNRGAGSVQAARVNWRGVKRLSPRQAEEFTPGKFFMGDKWIPKTGVPYVGGMMKV